MHEDLSVQNLSAQIVQAKAQRCIRRWVSKLNQTKETLKPQDKAIQKRAMTSAPFPRCLNVLALPKPPAFGLCCLIGLVVCLAMLRHELLHKLKVRPNHALFDHTQANIFAPEKNGTDIAPEMSRLMAITSTPRSPMSQCKHSRETLPEGCLVSGASIPSKRSLMRRPYHVRTQTESPSQT